MQINQQQEIIFMSNVLHTHTYTHCCKDDEVEDMHLGCTLCKT